MIYLLSPDANAYMLTVDALPEPSDRAYSMAANRASKLYDVLNDAWGKHLKAWENGKRRPTPRDCAELAWIASHARDAMIAYDGVANDLAIFTVTFATKAQSLVFKLTFGGEQCEPLAFAA
jgi:hypothetical protein